MEDAALVDLLRRYGAPEELLSGMSPLLRARMVPVLNDEEAMAEAMLCGTPFLAPRAAACDVFDTVGADGVEFITDARWNRFAKPKLAMVGGWGGPGTPVLGADHVALVESFSQCLDDARPINLQMFHRGDTENLPSVARKLRWPLGMDDGERNLSVVLDEATRVSAQGAVTWWHLDDGGEFTFQVGLPIDGGRASAADTVLGPEGRPAVKLFVFAPKEAYTLVFQDSVMNATGNFAVFDPFKTPSDALPAAAMPTFWVAALEAGGRPLLSAPNLPHCVVTVRSCVMVEQRRVLLPFLDESLYFIERLKCWDTSPQLYTFLANDMKDPRLVRSGAVEPLLRLLRRGDAGASKGADRGTGTGAGAPSTATATATATSAGALARLRLAARNSLQAVLDYPAHFAADAATVRRIRSALEAPPAAPLIPAATRERLLQRSAVQAAELKRMSAQVRGVSDCAGWRGRCRGDVAAAAGATTTPGAPPAAPPAAHAVAAYVHSGGRARWGPARATIGDALRDRKILQDAAASDMDAAAGAKEGEVGRVGVGLADALRALRAEVAGSGARGAAAAAEAADELFGDAAGDSGW